MKLIGLYVALSTLPSVVLVAMPFIKSYQGGSPWVPALVNTVSGALQIGVGMALWWFADGVAEFMVKTDEGATQSLWTELAFASLGLYFAADAAAHLVQAIGVLLLINYPPNITVTPPDNFTVVMREAVPQLVRGGIGLWILLGAKGIVRGVMDLKNVGRDPEVEELK